mmetsp:Transcript_19529/g.39809  ORF Transcript_19529/g.39809 Transcript_19529/m.39809 type:complete len:260 (+) Transcript_19529:164-943(+)
MKHTTNVSLAHAACTASYSAGADGASSMAPTATRPPTPTAASVSKPPNGLPRRRRALALAARRFRSASRFFWIFWDAAWRLSCAIFVWAFCDSALANDFACFSFACFACTALRVACSFCRASCLRSRSACFASPAFWAAVLGLGGGFGLGLAAGFGAGLGSAAGLALGLGLAASGLATGLGLVSGFVSTTANTTSGTPVTASAAAPRRALRRVPVICTARAGCITAGRVSSGPPGTSEMAPRTNSMGGGAALSNFREDL